MFFEASAFNDLKKTAAETNAFDPTAPEVMPPKNEGFFKQATDAFRYQRASGNTTSSTNMFWAEMERDWAAIQEERKKDGFNPFEPGTIFDPRDFSKGINSDEFGQKYEELRAKYPAAAARSFEEIRAAVGEKVENLRLEAELGNEGVLSKAGGFMGTMAGAMTDPVNIAFMLVAAPPGASLGRVLLTEAAGGAASELIVQHQVKKFNESIGNEYGLKEQAEAVAMAAGGAAAFPLIGRGAKGLYGYVKRLAKEKGASLPVRATDRSLVEKEFIEETFPGSKRSEYGEPEILHEKKLNDAGFLLKEEKEISIDAYDIEKIQNVQPVFVDDYKIDTRYEVVDLDELKTSDAADYPAELQPRDRSRQASADQVGEISRNLDPERLGRHTDADRGAPIVSPEGFVESGNGRTMAIRKAYEENPAAAARYKKMVEAEAKALGFDVSGMKNPVLIRRRLTDLTPEERLSFVEAANRSTSLAYSISEKAAIDAQRLDGELLDLFQGGDLTTAKNAEFVRQFRKAAVSKEEVAGFVTSNGTLSRAGEERIQAALFAKAYGDRELASLLFENESNIKSIGRALMDAAAEFAKLKEDIKAGVVAPEYDITQSIIDAVNLVRSARDAGETVADAVNQLDLFAPDNGRLTGILKTFFRDENFKRPVSAEKTAEALKRYARAARNQRKDQLSMFDVSSTPDEILGEGFSKIKAEDALFSPDAKETADFLKAKEAVEQVRIDKEMDKVKAEVGKIDNPFDRSALEAVTDGADFAEKMLEEATTCRF